MSDSIKPGPSTLSVFMLGRNGHMHFTNRQEGEPIEECDVSAILMGVAPHLGTVATVILRDGEPVWSSVPFSLERDVKATTAAVNRMLRRDQRHEAA